MTPQPFFPLNLVEILASLTVLPILVGLGLLGIGLLVRPRRSEIFVTTTVTSSLTIATAAAWLCWLYFSLYDEVALPILRVSLATVARHSVEVSLSLDRLSLPFVVATTSLSLIVSAFSARYLWRDRGHGRFFFLVLLFALGMLTLITGASFEVIFIGWELIGLCSALLISFFFERPTTSNSALKAFWAYRLSDTALLMTALLVGDHHFTFPPAPVPLEGIAAIMAPILLLLAAGPKSAQVPFSSWLPRAMEGPTPSSAIFYGGLSVHAGLYLVLRAQEQLLLPEWFFLALIILGIATAMYGALLQRVQSDIKSLLAYASLTQVGIMFAEVGCGFPKLAIVHFLGHATLRTYQILSAGSLLHEGKLHRLSERAGRPQRGLANKLFVYAFEWGLRESSGTHSVLNAIERISVRLQGFEQALASGVSRLVSLVLQRTMLGSPVKNGKPLDS